MEESQMIIKAPYFIKLKSEVELFMKNLSLESSKRKEETALFRQRYLERLNEETSQLLGEIRKDLSASKNEVKTNLESFNRELQNTATLEKQRRNQEFRENQQVVKETLKAFIAELRQNYSNL